MLQSMPKLKTNIKEEILARALKRTHGNRLRKSVTRRSIKWAALSPRFYSRLLFNKEGNKKNIYIDLKKLQTIKTLSFRLGHPV